MRYCTLAIDNLQRGMLRLASSLYPHTIDRIDLRKLHLLPLGDNL